jgi:hypothetical protein
MRPRHRLAALVCAALVASFASLIAVRTAVHAAPGCTSRPSFASSVGLNLVSDAQIVAPALRLTNAAPDRRGAAWNVTKFTLTGGFVTDFTFQITGRAGAADSDGPGGDGFAFVIQNSSPTTIGGPGGAVGFVGIPNSVGVEFDTFDNGVGNGDPNGNHVDVRTQTAQLGAQSLTPLLQDGAVHSVHIVYVPSGELRIFVDDLATPALTVSIDLVTMLSLDNGQAWLGFTAGTGAAVENHDVLSWTVCESSAPEALDDGATVAEDTSIDIDVLANDSDPDGDPLTVVGVSDPAHGTAAVVGNSVRYTPDPNFNGPDSFTYTIDDGDEGSAIALVSVTVQPVNDVPLASDGSATTPSATPVVVDLAQLVSDVETSDGDLTYVIDQAPLHGLLSGAGPAVTYTPDSGFGGLETFVFHVVDRGDPDGCGVPGSSCAAALGSAMATVSIAVETPSNPPPVVDAGPDVASAEGDSVLLDGLASDSEPVAVAWTATPGPDVDPDAICTFTDAADPTTTVRCTDDGRWTLILAADDGTNATVTDTATLTLTNVAPVVNITAPPSGGSVGLGETLLLEASVADAGKNDTHTCSIEWGDGTVETGTLAGGVCSGAHSYAAAGQMTITVTATDDDAATGSDTIGLVAVERAAGKVAGGGWLRSQGRISFGFVVRADAGGLHGELQVHAGKHDFHGTTVTHLVTAENTAGWTGSGRWDGDAGYTYEVHVVDNRNGADPNAEPDTFEIRIRDASGELVFSAAGALSGGNVRVH